MTLDVATQCLKAYAASLQPGIARKATLRSAYLTHQPGLKAIQWYQDSRVYDRCDVSLHPQFFDLMAHGLVAERAEEKVWQLLHIMPLPAAVRSPARRAQSRDFWRSPLLRALIWARMFWSADSHAFSNGVTAYMRAADDEKRRQLRPELRVNRSIASEYLHRFIVSVQPQHLSAEALDRFIACPVNWRRQSNGHHEFDKSYHMLVHPTKPDPRSALAFLERFDRELSRSTEWQSRFLQPGSRGSFRLYMFVKKLAQVLDGTGHRQQAFRALDIGLRHLPHLFNTHFDPSFGQPKEIPFQRRPSELEIKRGIALDKDGYVVRPKILPEEPGPRRQKQEQ